MLQNITKQYEGRHLVNTRRNLRVPLNIRDCLTSCVITGPSKRTPLLCSGHNTNTFTSWLSPSQF